MELTLTVNTDDCWHYAGSINSRGYGVINSILDGKRIVYMAHRLTYEYFTGLEPGELDVDHLCMVPCCVNPDHLEAVTKTVNVQRAIMARNGIGKPGYCKRGHELTPDNSRYSINKRTGAKERQCRQCGRDTDRARYWKQRNNLESQGGNEQ